MYKPKKLKFLRMLLVIALLLLIVGCGKFRNRRRGVDPSEIMPSAQYKPGNYKESLLIDGLERTYLLYIPQGFSASTDYPLVAVFHGGGGSGEKIASQTGFAAKADKEVFIAVFPDGIEHNWNDGRDTTDAFKHGIDDLKFIRTLIGNLKSKLPIDSKRIYAAGVSNGGIFSHRLGCEMSDVFAAIAPDVGSLATNLASRCSPAKPIAVAVIQGTDDPFIPIEGGDTKNKKFKNLGDGGAVLSAEDAMEFWAEKNGCQSNIKITNLPLRVNDGTSVTKKEYTQCRDNAEVVYYIANGMGHTWPPKSPQLPAASGKTSQNIDATEVFWEFFKTHSKK